MAPPTLESVPFEILQSICRYLDRENMPSVLALARASRRCFRACAPLIFHTIKFSVSSNSQLTQDVQECCDMLQRTASFGHVRRLVVDGQSPSTINEPDPQYRWQRPKITGKDRGYNGGALERADTWYEQLATDDIPAENAYMTNHAWQPLAFLIKQLPALVDLIYGGSSQFPPCLLYALHGHQPLCRLHINQFKLRSLNDPVTDAYEFELITSPCLYSITVRCTNYSCGIVVGKCDGSATGGFIPVNQDYGYEATKLLIAGLAPNLKEVCIHHIDRSPPASIGPTGLPCQPWTGFKLESGQCQSLRGSLSRFYYFSNSWPRINVDWIKDWKAVTDFSKLQSLQLQAVTIDEAALEYLSTNCKFPSLSTFAMRIYAEDMRPPATNDYFEIAQQFLCNLPPLSGLKLSGNIQGYLNDRGEVRILRLVPVLAFHGSTLRELRLSPFLGGHRALREETAQIIRLHCPFLEVLEVTLYRTKGDAREVTAYKDLGSLSNLIQLSLSLDASDCAILWDDEEEEGWSHDSANDPSFSDFDQQLCPRFNDGGWLYPRNGHLRDAFINSAVDEALARSVFGVISLAKPEISRPLKSLEIKVVGGGCLGPRSSSYSDLESVFMNLSRSWKLTRDEISQDLIVKGQVKMSDSYSETGLSDDIKPIFRKIWSEKYEGSDWRHDWHSFPLATPDT